MKSKFTNEEKQAILERTYQNPSRLQVLSNLLEFQKAPSTSGYQIIERSKRKPNEKA